MELDQLFRFEDGQWEVKVFPEDGDEFWEPVGLKDPVLAAALAPFDGLEANASAPSGWALTPKAGGFAAPTDWNRVLQSAVNAKAELERNTPGEYRKDPTTGLWEFRPGPGEPFEPLAAAIQKLLSPEGSQFSAFEGFEEAQAAAQQIFQSGGGTYRPDQQADGSWRLEYVPPSFEALSFTDKQNALDYLEFNEIEGIEPFFNTETGLFELRDIEQQGEVIPGSEMGLNDLVYFIRQPDGSLSGPHDTPEQTFAQMMDQILRDAVITGDYTQANKISDFQNRMTPKDRLEFALRIAQSPGDYMTYWNLFRGTQPNIPFKAGVRRIPLAFDPDAILAAALGRPLDGETGLPDGTDAVVTDLKRQGVITPLTTAATQTLLKPDDEVIDDVETGTGVDLGTAMTQAELDRLTGILEAGGLSPDQERAVLERIAHIQAVLGPEDRPVDPDDGTVDPDEGQSGVVADKTIEALRRERELLRESLGDPNLTDEEQEAAELRIAQIDLELDQLEADLEVPDLTQEEIAAEEIAANALSALRDERAQLEADLEVPDLTQEELDAILARIDEIDREIAAATQDPAMDSTNGEPTPTDATVGAYGIGADPTLTSPFLAPGKTPDIQPVSAQLATQIGQAPTGQGRPTPLGQTPTGVSPDLPFLSPSFISGPGAPIPGAKGATVGRGRRLDTLGALPFLSAQSFANLSPTEIARRDALNAATGIPLRDIQAQQQREFLSPRGRSSTLRLAPRRF